MENAIDSQETEQKAKVWTSWDNPVLTSEQWKEARRAVEAGMSLQEAADTWGVDYEAVKKRAQREEWLTPTRIRTLAEKLAEAESRAVPSPEIAPRNALEAFTRELSEKRVSTLLKLAKLAEKGVEKAASAELPVESWQDAKIVADIALKLHQPDNSAVQVNIVSGEAGDWSGAFDGLIETEKDSQELIET